MYALQILKRLSLFIHEVFVRIIQRKLIAFLYGTKKLKNNCKMLNVLEIKFESNNK